jgi:lactate dehydrogenase-like 2-hydroxyacid dehydrogenase
MLLDQSRLAGWGLEEVRRVPFQELLAESDLILITASLNPHTRNAFNEQAFKQMRSTAVLVNVARGPIVNTDDLQTALLSGAIGGAALDVCDPEPLDCERYAQLLNMPDRCLITPHISSATVETREEMAALALDNLICGLQGHPLPQSYF